MHSGCADRSENVILWGLGYGNSTASSTVFSISRNVQHAQRNFHFKNIYGVFSEFLTYIGGDHLIDLSCWYNCQPHLIVSLLTTDERLVVLHRRVQLPTRHGQHHGSTRVYERLRQAHEVRSRWIRYVQESSVDNHWPLSNKRLF